MKILNFSHKISYTNNLYDHITVDIETTTKRMTLKGVKAVKYIAPDGEEFNTPANVFMQLDLARARDCKISFDTHEPTMFNLQTVIKYQRDEQDHTIIIDYHLIHEDNKQ